jgi:hypothetical protein
MITQPTATYLLQSKDPREHLFNILEIGLIERMANQDLPYFMVTAATTSTEPVIPAVVNNLWTLYHESECAMMQKNRAIWNRYRAFPGKPVDVPELLKAMTEILAMVRLDVLARYRPILDDEKVTYEVLTALIGYYRTKYRL